MDCPSASLSMVMDLVLLLLTLPQGEEDEWVDSVQGQIWNTGPNLDLALVLSAQIHDWVKADPGPH